MGTTAIFKPTAIQKKALALSKGGAKHILLFGGSRSGKTTVLVMAVIYRALCFAGSRHLICRYRAKDARSSVLRETLLPWLDNTIGKGGYTYLTHVWVKAEGVIYDKFDETMIVKAADMPKAFDRYAAGQDFGLNITIVKIGWLGDCVYVLCDYGAFNMTTQSFNEELAACGGIRATVLWTVGKMIHMVITPCFELPSHKRGLIKLKPLL